MVGLGGAHLGHTRPEWRSMRGTVGHSESASASPSHQVTITKSPNSPSGHSVCNSCHAYPWGGGMDGCFDMRWWAMRMGPGRINIWQQCEDPAHRQSHFVRRGPSSSWTKGFQMDLLNECIAAAHLLCQTITLPFILTPFTQCCWSLPLPLPSSYLRSSWSGSISSWTSSADGADMEGVQLKQVGHLSFLVR